MRLRVALPGIPNFVHLPAHAARHRGLFADAGMGVEIVRGDSGFHCFQLVQAGEVDLAWTSTVGLLRAAARGEAEHLRMIVAPVPRLDIQIGAVPEIASCDEFRGRRVAVQGPGTFTHAMLDAYLARCGLGIDYVVQVESSPDRSGDVTFGELLAAGDVVGCAAHADDLALIQHHDRHDLRVLANAWEYLPDFHYAGFVTDVQLIQRARSELGTFVSVLLASTEWLVDLANRAEVLEVAERITTYPPEVVASAYDRYVVGGLFVTDDRAAMPAEMLEATAAHQVEMRTIDRPPDARKVVDRSIWEAVTTAARAADL